MTNKELPPGACYPRPALLSTVAIPKASLALTLDSEHGSLQHQLAAVASQMPLQQPEYQQSSHKLTQRPPAARSIFKPASSRFRRSTLLQPQRDLNTPLTPSPMNTVPGMASAFDAPSAPETTTLPLSNNSSLFLHQGFWDILGLAQATGSSIMQPWNPMVDDPRPAAAHTLEPQNVGLPMQPASFAEQVKTSTAAQTQQRASPATRSPNAQLGKAKKPGKRFSADMIGRPTDFAHVCHASDADQAHDLLTRWHIDGQGKVADAAWSTPIKEAARLRARAHGIAQVQAARDQALQQQGKLTIANPSSSLFASSTATSAVPTPPLEHSSGLDPHLEEPAEHLNSFASDTIIIKDERTIPRIDGLPFEENEVAGWPSGPSNPEQQPSLETLEKATAAAIYFEQLYHGILKRPQAREQRWRQFEEALETLPEEERESAREDWMVAENEHLRELRTKIHVGSFAKLKTVGHGAFGVVTLVEERQSGELYAMKQLRKADMLLKAQEGHVRAERDFMSQASESTRWIVRLCYSFQDVDHLYLVMEWMGGGDLLNLLIERDVFPEDFARFYVAEMILAIEETHKLGFIHRDIKPDNFLFDRTGHVKLSDFGLATDHHWSHDGAYFSAQRKALMKKHGIDLNDGKASVSRGKGRLYAMPKTVQDDVDGPSILTWREKNRKKLAFSVVGTNNYMAPEVLRGLGYTTSCDWWSAGIISFEMLFGYPCFVSKSRHVTRQRILNWRSQLRFPTKPRISSEARGFIESLVCEPEERLGSMDKINDKQPNSQILRERASGHFSTGDAYGQPTAGSAAAALKAHPWFRDLDFHTIHLQPAPFQPQLKNPADTRHFDEDIPAEPLAPAEGHNPGATKDALLRRADVLDLRKSLAFKGYTYKKPRLAYDPRRGMTSEQLGQSMLPEEKRPAAMTSSTLMRSLSL